MERHGKQAGTRQMVDLLNWVNRMAACDCKKPLRPRSKRAARMRQRCSISSMREIYIAGL